MEALELRADVRTVVGKQVKNLRHQDLIPGVVYGHGIGSVAVQFETDAVETALRQAGTSTTVQVIIQGHKAPYVAIFRDVQIDPIKRNVRHVDLQALNINETVRVPVSLILVGESPLSGQGGIVLQVLNEVEIEALPTALIHSIEVDISSLTVGQSIMVHELVVPAGVTILTSPDEVVVQTNYIEEESAEDLEGAPQFDEVEVIKRGKDEEDEDAPIKE